MKRSDKNKILARLEALRKHDKEQMLRVDAAVADAMKNKAVWKPALPDYFWDDGKCAAEHRKDIMRRVVTVIELPSKNTSERVATPYYVRDPKAGAAQGYSRLVDIKTDKENAVEVLREEFRRVISLLERSLAVAEEIGLHKETLKLLEHVKKVSNKVA